MTTQRIIAPGAEPIVPATARKLEKPSEVMGMKFHVVGIMGLGGALRLYNPDGTPVAKLDGTPSDPVAIEPGSLIAVIPAETAQHLRMLPGVPRGPSGGQLITP